MRELEAQAKFLAPVIASAVARALEPMQKLLQAKDDQLAALAKRLDELPAPIEPDLEALAKAAAELVVVPEPIPGKNADEVDLEALAKAASELITVPATPKVDLEALAKAAAELVVVPEPIPGKNADEVDLEALAKAAAELVVVPEPIPGKNADPVDLDSLAQAAAALVVVPEPATVDLEALAKAAAEFVELPKVDLALLAAEAAALVVVPEPIAPKEVDLDELARSAAALVPAPVVPVPEDGRDAIDLEILPSIDESKQYPRGTYAAHRGGLWKSFERTHGMRGWECIVDGVDGVTVTQDSVREFSVTLSKSSGAESVLKASLPAMIYKGVWRPCAAEPGDTFTFGGSMWHCDKATESKPGESSDWTLATKRGRDGNDAVQIKRDPPEVVKL
jgi:hypothetical protein